MSPVSYEFANPFSHDGLWLRGNTHTHTTESDGQFSPEQTGIEYGKRGYDFVFLTDHRKRTVPPPLTDSAALLIPAEETDLDWKGSFFHVVVLGASKSLYRKRYASMNELIEMADAENALLIMAHPYWCGTRSQDFLDLQPFHGVEVFNTICDSIAKGTSAVHWDDMLDAGLRVCGFAADDFHHLDKGIEGGWIVVKARENSESAILDGIRGGLFYSTQGPEIHSITLGGDGVRVECSPVQQIRFVANRFNGKVMRAEEGKSISEAAWLPRGWLIPVTYVRIECVDASGRTAWSNPIYVRGDEPKPL